KIAYSSRATFIKAVAALPEKPDAAKLSEVLAVYNKPPKLESAAAAIERQVSGMVETPKTKDKPKMAGPFFDDIMTNEKTKVAYAKLLVAARHFVEVAKSGDTGSLLSELASIAA